MLDIQIDENQVRQIYLEKLKEKIKQVDAELKYIQLTLGKSFFSLIGFFVIFLPL